MKVSRVRRSGVTLALLAVGNLWANSAALGLDVITPPPTTLWKFLGIPQGAQALRDGVSNRFGNRPWTERRPPVRPLAHPENLESPNPAIKRAAEIKEQEDLAPQKIKAVKYLAKIGCGCYDKDGSVTAALVAALDDCTQRVRMATIQAITEATREGACTTCNQKCCCNEDLVKKLYEIAYEKGDDGCWLEPSQEVRDAAREAMLACCRGRGPEGPIYEEPIAPPVGTPVRPKIKVETPETPKIPLERPGVLPIPQERPGGELPPPGVGLPGAGGEDAAPLPPFGRVPPAAYYRGGPQGEFLPAMPSPRTSDDASGWELYGPVGFSTDHTYEDVRFAEYAPPPPALLPPHQQAGMRLPAISPTAHATAVEGFTGPEGFSEGAIIEFVPSRTAEPRTAPAMTMGARGTITAVEERQPLVRIQFEGEPIVPVGAHVVVYHQYLVGRTRLGAVRVVQSWKGGAIAEPVNGVLFDKIRRGDDAVYAPGE